MPETISDVVGDGSSYCNGMAISKNVAEEASKYFETLERQYLSPAYENKTLAMFYRCAIEAISMMATQPGINAAKDIIHNHPSY